MLSLLLLQVLLGALSVTAEPDRIALECDASNFKDPFVPGAKVLSIKASEHRNVDTKSPTPLFKDLFDLNFCNISVYLTHPGANDKVLVETWLPLSDDKWNNRFQATGGGGMATGLLDIALGAAIDAGYAASSTDGGHPRDYFDVSWMRDENHKLKWDLLRNFATRSLADQIHVGKSLTEQFYGRPAHHSYWNGCSQGGRQAMAVAQVYPGLLDGVLSAAPALKFPALSISGTWGAVVMNEADTLVSNCELDWFTGKALEECDILDGAKDGVIGDPDTCSFDPRSLVGQELECSGHKITVTEATADVVRKIQEGPMTPRGTNLFPGLSYGTLNRIWVNVTFDAKGVRKFNDPGMLLAFTKGFVGESLQLSDLTAKDFYAFLAQVHDDYASTLYTVDPDLSPFRNAGAKLLTWHGTVDSVIPYQTTVKYRQAVERELGSTADVDDFFRLFLVPGVEHCGLGPGAAPKDPLEELVRWVEKGEAPDTLPGEAKNEDGELITREHCLYPKTPRFVGTGDKNKASSWTCVDADDGKERLEGQKDFLGGLKDMFGQIGLQ